MLPGMLPGTLNGKTAIVTGSTSGIGLGIATALAAEGVDVVLNGFGDPAEIERQRAALADAHGVRAAYVASDMAKPAEIRCLVAEAERRFGRVDILVNNAGIQHVAKIVDFPEERWDQVIAINLSAAFHTTRLALPAMKARGFGRIINVASAHALVASPFKSAYVAAKHGVAGLTKTIALEGAEFGVTANAICPGYVLTPLVEKQIPDTAKARGISEAAVVRDVLLAAQPTRKFVTIDEVAALAIYLASDAAGSTTGTIIPVDGGWTAH